MELPKLIKIDNTQKDKPFLVVMAPFATRSGYGEHSRDIIRSIIRSDKYRVGLVSLNWGMTPLNALDEVNDQDILSRMILNPGMLQQEQPDIFIHITIPNEFIPAGKYNIGITAGIETTVCRAEWIEGINRMDKTLVPSEFTKHILESSVYTKTGPNNEVIGELRTTKPIEVVFEGTDTDIFYPIQFKEYEKLKSNIKTKLDNIKEDFAILVVGHWLKGEMGQDRKDIGVTIQLFLDVFKNKNIKKKPCLVIKTSGASFSVRDRLFIEQRIQEVRKHIELCPDEKLPNIYLIHGDLSAKEMNELYNHPKIKAMLSLTKGEGYGRPLQEFAFVGKPVLVSNWSGQVDFIKSEYHTLLEGEVLQVHPSVVDDFIIAESGWFTVNYQKAGDKLFNLFEVYSMYKDNAKRGVVYLNNEKTLFKMQDVLINSIENKNIKLTLPTNLNLPKLNLPNIN